MKRKYKNCYIRVMKEVSLNDRAKQRIIRNSARYSTLYKIRNSNFVITSNKTEKTTDG